MTAIQSSFNFDVPKLTEVLSNWEVGGGVVGLFALLVLHGLSPAGL